MATLIDQQFSERLRALNAKYAANVPATLARLREQRSAVNAAAPEPGALTAMQDMLHTIAGSAATFGLGEFGRRARALEQRLRALRAAQNVPAHDWEYWLGALDAYIAWAEIDPHSDSATK